MKVDIIGAGFSGLSAAISLIEHNPKIDVAIYEKSLRIGYNPDGRRCGEAHDVIGEWKKWMPSEKSIFNTITCGKLIFGNKELSYNVKNNTGFILNRPEFLVELAKIASDSGAKIYTNYKIKSIDDLTGDYIIDASGSTNRFKKELGIKRRSNGLAYQETLRNSNAFQQDTIHLHFTGQNGYYWIFPRNPIHQEINIGIGFSHRKITGLKKRLHQFKNDQHISGDISYITAGIIPVGLQPPYLKDNILFVGDTAVGTFPYTGKGIYRALISGDIAAYCIATRKIRRYPYLIRNAFVSREEVICSLFLRMTRILGNINPKLVLSVLPSFFETSLSIDKCSKDRKI